MNCLLNMLFVFVVTAIYDLQTKYFIELKQREERNSHAQYFDMGSIRIK